MLGATVFTAVNGGVKDSSLQARHQKASTSLLSIAIIMSGFSGRTTVMQAGISGFGYTAKVAGAQLLS